MNRMSIAPNVAAVAASSRPCAFAHAAGAYAGAHAAATVTATTMKSKRTARPARRRATT